MARRLRKAKPRRNLVRRRVDDLVDISLGVTTAVVAIGAGSTIIGRLK